VVGNSFRGMLVDVITNISINVENEMGELEMTSFSFTATLKEADDHFLYFAEEGDYISLAVATKQVAMMRPTVADDFSDFGDLN
jgi:rRNA pseudouridine-1189 N-methylase Emg1 (Nep1/Mra1 family)